MALPTFLGIGGQRCGSTTLHHFCAVHPDIFVSTRVKEINFFSNPTRFAEGPYHYEAAFLADWNGEKHVGDISPAMLRIPGTPERIAKVLGRDVLFILIVRDPVERAFSDYRHTVSYFFETEAFEDALAMEPARRAAGRVHNDYIAASLYGAHLRRYLEWFDLGQFLILSFEDDLAAQPQATFDRIADFLGVARHPFDGHLNKARPFEAAVNGDGSVKVGQATVRRPSRDTLAGATSLSRRMTRELSPQQKSAIYERYFAEDWAEFKRLVGW